MNGKLILFFASLITFASSGQCGRKHPSGLYHHYKFVNEKGDTLNKEDSKGYYEGLHVEIDNEGILYNDTITYILGCYKHGLPIGEWKDHCRDGSFSIGQFDYGEMSSTDTNGVVTYKTQGIYSKKGIWKYYDKNSKLIKIERYDNTFNRKGTTYKTYLADSAGNFILMYYDFNDNHLMVSKLKKTVIKKYTNKGLPVQYNITNFWRDVYYEFNEMGHLMKFIKQKKFFGYKLKTSLEKSYDDGKLKFKTKTRWKKGKSLYEEGDV